MEVMVGDKSKDIRESYIQNFINQEGAYYKKRILNLIECTDGLCYWGYLWDCYKSIQLISEEECNQYVKKHKNLLIMWDINSKDYIFIPNYWKYPKDAVLSLSVEEYERIKDTLPEDIYLFDESFTWSIALTHETIYEEERYCCFTHSKEKYDVFPDKRIYTKEELET